MTNSIDLRKQKSKIIRVQISTITHGTVGHIKYEHLVTFPHNTTFTHTIICTSLAFEECFKAHNEAGYSVVFENNYPK